MQFVRIDQTELTITLTIPEAIEVERALKQVLSQRSPLDVFGRLSRQDALRVQHALDAVLDDPVRV